MLYGMGEPDGTGKLVGDYECNGILTLTSSADTWLQTRSPIRDTLVVSYIDIYPVVFAVALQYIHTHN